MKNKRSNKEYSSPEVVEFGGVESITQQSNKEGGATDQYSDTTPLIGSIQPAN